MIEIGDHVRLRGTRRVAKVTGMSDGTVALRDEDQKSRFCYAEELEPLEVRAKWIVVEVLPDRKRCRALKRVVCSGQACAQVIEPGQNFVRMSTSDGFHNFCRVCLARHHNAAEEAPPWL